MWLNITIYVTFVFLKYFSYTVCRAIHSAILHKIIQISVIINEFFLQFR